MSNPFRPEEFAVSAVSLTDGIGALKISLPDPSERILCRRIYAFCGRPSKEAGYFCIEYGSQREEREHGLHLCRWLPNGIHLNYGIRHRTQEQEFLECAENYRVFDPDKIQAALIPDDAAVDFQLQGMDRYYIEEGSEQRCRSIWLAKENRPISPTWK